MTTPELSEQDLADLRALGAEVPETEGQEKPATQRTLLEVWREILSNTDKAREEHIHPELATRILRAWPFLKIQEVSRYHELYFDYLDELRQIVLVEIDLHPEALLNTDDDAESNKAHYLNLLLQWQLSVQEWGFDWDSDGTEAHIRIAALADAQNFVLGVQGLVAHLDAINFEFTEQESLELQAILDDAKVGR